MTLLAATLSGGESAQAAGVAQIAWSDAAHTGVRVSWPAYDGALKLILKSPLLEPRTLADQVTGTESVVSKELFPRPVSKAVIEVHDAKTNELVAQSVEFDTNQSYPTIDWPAKVSANGTVTVSWTITPNGEDINPKDPLDVTLNAAQVRMTGTNGCTWKNLPATTGQHGSVVLPYQKPPFKVSTIADAEWGQVRDQGLAVVNFAVSQKVPASTPYGDDMRIPFTSDAIRPGQCVNGVAGAPYKVPVQNPVDLQKRANSSAGWQGQPAGGPWPGAHPKVFLETSLGARQYRTVAYNDAEAVVLSIDGDSEVT